MTTIFFTLWVFVFVLLTSVYCNHLALETEKTPHRFESQKLSEKIMYNVLSRMEQSSITFTNLTDIVKEVNREPFSAEDRRVVLQTCIAIIEGLNPNFNIRNRFLKINPVRRMKRFLTEAPFVSNLRFHIKMKEIFNSMRDLHTAYVPPASLRTAVAVLGISIRPFVSRSTNRLQFIISEKIEALNFLHGNLTVGITVLSVDGIPVENLTKQLGRQSGAGNEASQIRFGSVFLTQRRLASDTIPTKPTASVRYLSHSGSETSINIPWVYLKGISDPDPETTFGNARIFQAAKFQSMIVQKQFIFKQATKQITVTNHTMLIQKNDLVPQHLKPFLSAAQLTTEDGTFGYLALSSFSYPPTPKSFQALREIISKLPKDGLVIDIRGNDGGYYSNAYMLLRTFSNVSLNTYPLVERVSKLSLKYATSGGLTDSQVLKAAFRLGEPYTGPFSDLFGSAFRTEVDRFDPVFHGPVLTIADGATVSAADLFPSFCRDYRVCRLINVDGSTGGLGESVGLYFALKRVGNVTFFPDLPLNISISTAFLRLFRSGTNSGALISYVGVEPDVKYNYTREDILNDDQDLLRFSGIS